MNIKLRAWCEKNKEMYFPDEEYCFKVYNTSIGFYPHYDSDELERYNTNPSSEEIKIIVMQYTGLKDKNGVEIYEGDIVFDDSREYGRNKQVIWDERGCKFDLDYPLGHSLTQTDHLEVIGNRHQHPELLTT